jgi:alkanesulfonate monooxygenase SsuD/methylene tetrahydromethanopterin reductase-like flavin-dependent oxidoreductase (luciferase family)
LKFGYFSQLQMPKPWHGENAEVDLHWSAMREAIHAEEVGFDSYWQTEHHFYTEIGHSSAPEVFLAALAQRTKRIRLGTGVVVLPCNHPYRVAEQISTLDILSNGRVEFGTGRGASVYHIEAFGVGPAESRQVWEESLEVICSLFLNDKFPGHKGAYYDLPPRSLVPKPVQKPHPPIWVAATSPSTFEAAARLGLGVLGLTSLPPEHLIPAIRAYRDAQADCTPIGGVVNHQIAAYSICYVDEDDRRGQEIACAAARWYLGDNQAELQKVRFGTIVGGPFNNYHEAEAQKAKDRLGYLNDRTNEQLIEDGIVIGGNPDRVCRQIEKWEKVGIDKILLMIQAGYTSHDQVMRSQELIGKHVIPRFRDVAAEPAPAAAR